MVADTKKCQTLINICAQQMTAVRAAADTMEAMRDLFVAINPDTTGTPLHGNLATLSNALTALAAEAGRAVWTQLIAAEVPSHRNKALEV